MVTAERICRLIPGRVQMPPHAMRVIERHGRGRSAAGGDAGGRLLGQRRRGYAVLGTGDDLGGNPDAAQFRTDVKGGQRFAAERVAEAVRVAEGMQELAAELGLAFHEARCEPALRGTLDHHRGSLVPDGLGPLQPRLGRP